MDDFAQALMELGVESGVFAEELEKFARLASLKTIEQSAIEWAAVEHPELLLIYNRTKKKRIKKKYSNRIINAWAENLGGCNETMAE